MDEASYAQGFEDAQRATLSALDGGMPCSQVADAIREDLAAEEEE